jgi:hypothetical protein
MGTVKDEQFVSEIALSGELLFMETSGREKMFSQEMDLDEGRHVLEIAVRNLLGGVNQQRIVVHVDRSGPVVALDGTNSKMEMQGTVYDESGVKHLFANSSLLDISKGKEASFSLSFNPTVKEIILLAVDRLGNQTRAAISAEDLGGKDSPLIAFRKLPIKDTGNPILAMLGANNMKMPQIILDRLNNYETCFLERVFIEGHVKSEDEIVRLTIGDSPIIRQPARMVFFNRFVRLEPGANIIQIVAEDKSGKTNAKKIIVNRKIPTVYQLEHRYSMRLSFINDNNQCDWGELIQEFLLQSFVEQGRFRVLTPNETRTSVASPFSTFAGKTYETRSGIEIVARLIDNATSQILSVNDVYGESKNPLGLKRLTDRLSVKLSRDFPMAEGSIVHVNRKQMTASFEAADQKLKLGWPIIAYRKATPSGHRNLDKLLGSDTTIIGTAELDEKMKSGYGATIETGKRDDIRAGDGVITR